MATRKKRNLLKKNSKSANVNTLSVIVEIAKMGDSSIAEKYEKLKEYREKLAKSKAVSIDEINTLKRMVKLIRMKSLAEGNEELFKKLGKLEKEYEKIERRLI